MQQDRTPSSAVIWNYRLSFMVNLGFCSIYSLMLANQFNRPQISEGISRVGIPCMVIFMLVSMFIMLTMRFQASNFASKEKKYNQKIEAIEATQNEQSESTVVNEAEEGVSGAIDNTPLNEQNEALLNQYREKAQIWKKRKDEADSTGNDAFTYYMFFMILMEGHQHLAHLNDTKHLRNGAMILSVAVFFYVLIGLIKAVAAILRDRNDSALENGVNENHHVFRHWHRFADVAFILMQVVGFSALWLNVADVSYFNTHLLTMKVLFSVAVIGAIGMALKTVLYDAPKDNVTLTQLRPLGVGFCCCS